ncbi:DUF6702 family protein [Belliella kenyensis]|uniref:DUF6702 family protein n=1 Tax=Belliella kenyensis TaxID=1472724 RepID=A0ABV8EQW9_9BACT|nr:DUF6702 family protein [Belliella kenyensis]MCH7401605.1 hypothetical protein [Belliella kenyensis]MDN3603115.1 hypothetical protein [Belliella kenyensis]
MVYNYILIIWLGWKAVFHPFYISLTDIRFNEEELSLEIAQKIFWDDLEISLSKTFDSKVDFIKPESPERLENMVKKYLLTHNQIIVNGKELKLSYLGYEIEEDAAWFYLEARVQERPKSVKIKNTLLIKEFQEQQNLVNFYLSKRPKSIILHKEKTNGNFQF